MEVPVEKIVEVEKIIEKPVETIKYIEVEKIVHVEVEKIVEVPVLTEETGNRLAEIAWLKEELQRVQAELNQQKELIE